jgi:hypothetical protein
MNLKAKLLFQKRTPHFPRQQQRNELEKVFMRPFPTGDKARDTLPPFFLLKRLAFCTPRSRYFSRVAGSRNRSKSFANPSVNPLRVRWIKPMVMVGGAKSGRIVS